jgi:hypothetical protein
VKNWPSAPFGFPGLGFGGSLGGGAGMVGGFLGAGFSGGLFCPKAVNARAQASSKTCVIRNNFMGLS